MEGRTLSLSNLDKVFYPETGFTKGQVIEYYTRVAPVLLPHLRDRHLTLKRYPNGVDGEFFYEKQCPGHRPDWVRTAAVWSRHNGREIDYCVADDLSTVVWLANLADLEMHTPLARAEDRVWLAAGAHARLGLWAPGRQEFGDRGGAHVHFAFSAAPGCLDELAERLATHGVSYRGPVEHDGGDRSVYLEDPEGNVVEAWDFFEHGAGADEGVEALR